MISSCSICNRNDELSGPLTKYPNREVVLNTKVRSLLFS
jgi:hypothetical protein